MSHYDASFIQKRICEFKERMMNYTGQRTVLFDADNTLYLFSHHGMDKQAVQRCHNKGFFKNLPIFDEAPYVISNLQNFGINVGILSAYTDGYAYEEKLISFQYHFPMVEAENIYLVKQGTVKTSVVEDIEHTILVDDYHQNINDWYNAGGVAIKKSYSGKSRPVPIVTSLIDIFYVLDTLNFLR